MQKLRKSLDECEKLGWPVFFDANVIIKSIDSEAIARQVISSRCNKLIASVTRYEIVRQGAKLRQKRQEAESWLRNHQFTPVVLHEGALTELKTLLEEDGNLPQNPELGDLLLVACVRAERRRLARIQRGRQAVDVAVASYNVGDLDGFGIPLISDFLPPERT